MSTLALIPAYNERYAIAEVVMLCRRYVDQVIVCDDGSKDRTGEIAASMGALVISHSKNRGKGAAVRSLFEKAMSMGCTAAVVIDGDLQHDPKDIPRLLAGLGSSDVVIGARVRVPGMVKGIGNMVASFGSDVDTQSGFRAYRGDVLGYLIPSEDGYGVETEILRKAEQRKMRVSQIRIEADYKVPNPSKRGFFIHTGQWLSTEFKLQLLEHPILLVMVPGVFLLLLGIFLAIHDLQYLLTEGMGSILLMVFGMMLVSTAVVISVLSYIVRSQRSSR